MTSYATQGWDIVGAIDQRTLNVELGILYTKKGLPKHIETDFSNKFFKGSLSAAIGPPTVNLGGVTQGIAELTFEISEGTAKFGDAEPANLAGLIFTVSTAVGEVELHTEDALGMVLIYVDFLSKQMTITLHASGPDLDEEETEFLNLLLRLSFKKLEQGTYYLASVVRGVLDIPDFLVPRLVAFTLVPFPNKPELNELLVLVQTIGLTGQKNYNDTLIPADRNAVLLLSNERLLTNVVGDGLEKAIPTGKFAYSPNDFHLTGKAKYGDNDLTGAHATVKDNAIHVKLNVAAMGVAGGGVNVFVDSDTKITVVYDSKSASFQVTQKTPKPESSYSFEWWAAAITVLTAGLLVAPIIAVIIGEISKTVAVGISEKEITKAFAAVLKPIKWPANDYVTPAVVNFPEPAQMFVVPTT